MGWEALLTWVSGKVDRELRLKIEYLVAENRILRDQIAVRPKFTDAQRSNLATLGAKLGKRALEQVASIVTPETILRWHRQLVARKFDTSDRRKAKAIGRPPMDPAVIEQIVRFARDNPVWGYRRIAGAIESPVMSLDIASAIKPSRTSLKETALIPLPLERTRPTGTSSSSPIPIAF